VYATFALHGIPELKDQFYAIHGPNRRNVLIQYHVRGHNRYSHLGNHNAEAT
jgi:hypothetical protein